MKRPEMREADVSDHGIIGNLRTAALVASDGTIDWMCHPAFDSPSVFAAILDPQKGGVFALRPSSMDGVIARQTYIPDTNVLQTRFWRQDAVACLTDFMPLEPGKQDVDRHRLLRRLEVTRGSFTFDAWCEPRFDYARVPAQARRVDGGIALDGPESSLVVLSKESLEAFPGAAGAAFSLREGEARTFALETCRDTAESDPSATDDEVYENLLQTATSYWRNWLRACTYNGRWREQVHRSALVLKLLTYQPTGAMVAAPTCSLPTDLGGVRNWDYRYTWFRDASFVVYALVRIGFREEANAFMEWVKLRCKDGPQLRPLYSIAGDAIDSERTLDYLAGHKNSRPVRVGNLATNQLQLDLYGALLDAVYLFNKYGMPIDRDLWLDVRSIVDWLCDHWQDPDRSLWEVRSPPGAFTASRVFSWVAIDRALRLAQARSLPAPVEHWRDTRDEIMAWVEQNAWNEDVGAFVQKAGSTALDASALLMPMLFFASPRDTRVQRTVAAIQRDLSRDALVVRYKTDKADDGLPGNDGAFAPCSFWLVEALTREGRLGEARTMFETLLRLANPLGLYAEQFTFDGRILGNFPQALTHLAFISAAVNLDRALNDTKEPAMGRGSSTAWRAYTEPQERGDAA